MRTRSVGLAAVLTFAISATALAAAPSGSYSGTSSNDGIWRYGAEEEVTDKGRVTFSVKSSVIRKFKLSGQEFMCGAGAHVVPVAVAKIKLDPAGRGKGTYKDPTVGDFKVSIKVTSSGRASGTVKPTGLCAGVAKFKAARR
jgi:hypothetical protein